MAFIHHPRSVEKLARATWILSVEAKNDRMEVIAQVAFIYEVAGSMHAASYLQEALNPVASKDLTSQFIESVLEEAYEIYLRGYRNAYAYVHATALVS